jgi:hypothetical protein
MNPEKMRLGHPDPDLLARKAEEGMAMAESGVLEAHLASCAECQEEIAWIRRLRAEAAGLPRSMEPSRDLFPAIRARIAPGTTEPSERGRGHVVGRVTGWWSPVRVSAAALVLVALSSAITLHLARSGADNEPPEVAAGTNESAAGLPDGAGPEPGASRFASSGEAAVGVIEAAWGPTLRELESALVEGRERLQPETMEVIEANLWIIDQAIREAREALAADPGSQGAARSLNGMLETRAQVLLQVKRLAGA